MKELAARVQLYNNRLRERRVRLAMSPRQLAEAACVPYQVYLNYEALRVCPYPRRFHGHAWTITARRLAKFHAVTEEELFPQAVLIVKQREIERTFDAEEMYVLGGDGDGPPALPEAAIEATELRRDINTALSQFKPREQDIIRRRFVEGETLEEIATIYDLSRDRVRQIEAKVLRQLRSPNSGLRGHA